MRRTIVMLVVGKISLVVLCGVALAGYLVVASYKQLVIEIPVPTERQTILISGTPELTARAFAVFDLESGELLAAKEADTPYPIASVTKLIAAAAADSVLPLEATTTVTWSDVAAEGRAGKLAVSEQYTYRELLFPLLLESSNDAAAALERTHGAALLTRMGELAASYGAKTATFADTSGLSAANLASAHDLAKLTVGIHAEHPFVFDVTSLPQYIGEHTGWVNNNPVMHEANYRGGKHGYTEAAGRTIVALFDEELEQGNRTLGYVVLGSDNLKDDVATLRTFIHEAARLE